jgi:hypothetical protein
MRGTLSNRFLAFYQFTSLRIINIIQDILSWSHRRLNDFRLGEAQKKNFRQ